jgi:hypothetical protein
VKSPAGRPGRLQPARGALPRSIARSVRDWAAAALLAASAAGAATLIDPTLPPPSRAAAAAIAPTGSPAAAAPAPAKLQMILRGPGELRTALIDGQALHVGDRLASGSGEARVVRITDGSVELARGAAHETLELIPGQAQIVRCARHGAGTGAAKGPPDGSPNGPRRAAAYADPCPRQPLRAGDR